VNRLHIWRRILQKFQSCYKNGINIHERLTRASSQSCIDKPLPDTAKPTTLAIAQVRKDIRACLKKSNETRALEQLERIAMECTDDDCDKAKILHAMHKSEQHAQTYSMFRNIRGKSQQSSLTTVDIPDTWPAPGEPGNWCDPKLHAKQNRPFRQVTIPSDIEYYLMERNSLHSGQAHGTPFTQAPLAELLNWLILKGTYTNEELNDVTQLLHKHCEATTKLDTINTADGRGLRNYFGDPVS
jgi:hypothetical protein